MSSLPSLELIRQGASDPTSPLAQTLSILFEPSPILLSKLEPQLSPHLKSQPLPSYTHLITLALNELNKWDISSQSEFISGHPRIGETRNLSNLSAAEQGGATAAVNPTPPDVLARLKHLNACYEAEYPGLRYITFANGRSRAEIAEEMEDVLDIEHSRSPDEPPLAMFTSKARGRTDEKWLSELKRAVEDVGKIAESRLESCKLRAEARCHECTTSHVNTTFP
jgi:2-oxo-4-hydroxy-4-carboxy--5-ureidoimidazoline (OHCU) decarboxylase